MSTETTIATVLSNLDNTIHGKEILLAELELGIKDARQQFLNSALKMSIAYVKINIIELRRIREDLIQL